MQKFSMGSTTQPSRQPGRIIGGRYRLKECLASGGVGEVWIAEHCRLKQDVAIKFLKEELFSDPAVALSMLARFRFESQVSAMLGRMTRHVVNVHDAGTSEAGPFLAMEYVPGSSLADELLVYGPMPPERLATILDQVADALGAAHAVGIVHRDIKPANILVRDEPDGSLFVKIADFGIAKTTNEALPLDIPKSTAARTLVGTPDFMSPEQVQSGAVQPAMDIWALGITCYNLLTGKLPFKASTRVDRIFKIVFESFPSLVSLRPELPAALDAWLMRALAKKPADRFVSVKQMSEAYREAIGCPVSPPAGHEAVICRPNLDRTILRSENAAHLGASLAPTAPADCAAVEGEELRRTPLMISMAKQTMFTSAAAHLEVHAEPTRWGFRWRAVLAATAAAAALTAGLLVTYTFGFPAQQDARANRAVQSATPQPTISSSAGETAVSTTPGTIPERGPSADPPANAPLRRAPTKPTKNPLAQPLPTSMPSPTSLPPPSEPAPVPAPAPRPSSPHPRNPSSVL